MSVLYVRDKSGNLIPIPAIQGPPGPQGPQGPQGPAYTLSKADKAEIVAAVIESLGGNPVFGYVDENNNIIVSGNLADGTYSVKYEMEDGSTVEIGDLVLDSNVYYSVTNNLTNCTNSNSATKAVHGEPYSATISANDGYELKSVTVTMGGSPVTVSGGNISIEEVTGDIVITAVAEEIVASYTNLADPASSDWWTDSRIGSDGTQRTDKPGYVVTNFIGPLSAGDVVRVEGMDFATNPGASCPYKSDKSRHGSYGVAQLIHWVSNTSVMTNATINAEGAEFTSADSTIAYWRFCGKLTGTADDVIITINEPIE